MADGRTYRRRTAPTVAAISRTIKAALQVERPVVVEIQPDGVIKIRPDDRPPLEPKRESVF